ncbi:MAG: hypothetical protein QXY19_06685 [Archaeoglobaceae archaeon]
MDRLLHSEGKELLSGTRCRSWVLGYSPRPANPSVFNTANISACKRRCFYRRRSCGRFETFSSSDAGEGAIYNR